MQEGVYRGEASASPGLPHWVLAPLNSSCTHTCASLSPPEICQPHSYLEARGHYVLSTSLPEAAPWITGTMCVSNVTHASLSHLAPLLDDARPLPMVDELGSGGEGSLERSGPLASYVGSTCYLWDAPRDDVSMPPLCDAKPPIKTARRLCRCAPEKTLCGKTCMEALVQCMEPSQVGEDYKGEVAETFVPCLDDPGFQVATCDGATLASPQSECAGKLEMYGCGDYSPGRARFGRCFLDGAAECGVCPRACNMCRSCFQFGGAYYYGGVEKPHPDRHDDGYVTTDTVQRCGRGLAYCTAQGLEQCVAAGFCDSSCSRCASLSAEEPRAGGGKGGGTVASCSCSAWYRDCVSKIYLY